MNEIEMLRQRIDALEIIRQELRHYYVTATNVNVADELRRRINVLAEDIDVLRMRFDRLRATGVVPPVRPEDAERLRAALDKLDNYVRDNQNVQGAIVFLQQVASLLT